jgi:hypothetical protein
MAAPPASVTAITAHGTVNGRSRASDRGEHRFAGAGHEETGAQRIRAPLSRH